MTKRVFLLMGLAIFAVVVSHAAGWSEIAMIDWTDRYRSVAVPNYDAVGSFSYDLIVLIRKLVVWAVPAFLFCSGFFVAYAARGSRGVYSWQMARTRVIALLIPYTIWSVIWFIADALEHKVVMPVEYATRFITGTADGGTYWFIPMLCQFYLLSPVVVPMAKTKPKQLITIAALIQLVGFIVQYLRIFGLAVPPYISWIIESWLFFMWTTYFALGLVCGFHGERIKQAVLRYKWVLIGTILIFGFIAIFEAEIIYWSISKSVNRSGPFTFSAWLYSIAFVLAFLVFDKNSIPFPARFNQLGSQSYGIYLIHARAMSYVARIIRQIAPQLLAYPVLIFSPIMLIAGLAIPLLLMYVTSRTPARRYYRKLFG
jgi:membrane-bound acyltransferase YfiQ involved in biofilm formation